MIETLHKYMVEILLEDGTVAETLPATPDWVPAAECTRFEAIRSGAHPPVSGAVAGRVEPIWSNDPGPPYLRAVQLKLEGDTQTAAELPLTLFYNTARNAANDLVERGILVKGQSYDYRVAAYPVPPDTQDTPADLTTSAQVRPLLVSEAALAARSENAAAVESSNEATNDIPVFVPEHVLNETARCTEDAGAEETGGILIGHLRQDPASRAYFVEVTEQIPARHTQQGPAELTFTPETWAAVRDTIELRARGEAFVGWWHSHPAKAAGWCKDCPEERRRECPLQTQFFSQDDVEVHRAVFGAAFHVALVVTDTIDTGLSFAMYGWRNGLVQRRGFNVMRDANERHGPASALIDTLGQTNSQDNKRPQTATA